jgi:DNA-binding NarL/FixJ family response regulator
VGVNSFESVLETKGRRPTAIIADDHAALHPLLRRILEPEFEIAESVFDGQALVEATRRLSPDLIVVDVLMPVLDGIEAVKRLKARSSTALVVFISTDTGEQNVQRALETGALGFVRKASAAEHLIPAMRAALKGERYVSDGPSCTGFRLMPGASP